jgi:thiosulfate/3-mercaptopyruvate sulfurtransferase
MKHDPLISPARLSELIEAGDCLVVDCRFDFSNAGLGRNMWRTASIPGAVYAHLDDDLSSPVTQLSGRHPLPETSQFARFLAAAGWSPGRLLVACDEQSNAVASRLWWLMRYHGQESALLDGGLNAWVSEGFPLQPGKAPAASSATPELTADERMVVGTRQIEQSLRSGGLTVVDARAADRFRGQNETLDTRAGHIPGSLNRHFGNNLDALGRFKPAEELHAEFEALLGQTPGREIAHSCGSGVTACHNYFAMELAGIRGTRVYPGSWSEWIRDPGRPIAIGTE